MHRFTIPPLFFMVLCMIAGSWLSAVSFGICAMVSEFRARSVSDLAQMHDNMRRGERVDGPKLADTVLAVSARHTVTSIIFMGSIILAIFGA